MIRINLCVTLSSPRSHRCHGGPRCAIAPWLDRGCLAVGPWGGLWEEVQTDSPGLVKVRVATYTAEGAEGTSVSRGSALR